MAILGGGPGGPVGSSNSFTGTSEALELVGDHGYAYNSKTSDGTNETTYLEFTSGNYYLVGQCEFMYDIATNIDIKFDIYFGGNALLGFVIGNAGSAGSGLQPSKVNIIIPPYTDVKVTCQGSTSPFSVGITGRIYRG